MKPIIPPSELLQQFGNKSLMLIDARSGPDAFDRYAASHLKGALYVDLEKDLSQKADDASRGGRHPLPEIKNFASLLGKLGINKTSHVIVYDDKNGAFSAARFWWMMKALGHENVQVIDGGLQAAVAAGVPTTSKITIPKSLPPYPANEWQRPTFRLEDVIVASADKRFLIIDVREAHRYRGESEPIDLVAGHIPNAVNVPYLNNLDSEGKFLPPEELELLYKNIIGDHGLDHVIVHCGSGVTGCHTLLALEQAGITGANLYVGSWSEWSRNELPIAKSD